MQKKKLSTKTMAMVGVMAALYVVLSAYVSIKIGNIRITFASLTTLLMATLFGPMEGVLVAFIGEFINQMLSYGFSVTLFLWLLPPMIRAFTAGMLVKAISKDGKYPEDRVPLFNICLIIAALVTTTVNTFVIWADAKIYGYYSFAYVFGQTVTRFITGIVTAVVISLIITAIIKPIRKVVS